MESWMVSNNTVRTNHCTEVSGKTIKNIKFVSQTRFRHLRKLKSDVWWLRWWRKPVVLLLLLLPRWVKFLWAANEGNAWQRFSMLIWFHFTLFAAKGRAKNRWVLIHCWALIQCVHKMCQLKNIFALKLMDECSAIFLGTLLCVITNRSCLHVAKKICL